MPELSMSERYDKMLAALEEIAAYNDQWGSDRLSQTGSYSSFDEPGAVQTAREVLKEIKEH